MTRRGVFATITGLITGLFETARARDGQAKDVRMYYLSYFVPRKSGEPASHYYLVPFYTEHKEIILAMDRKLNAQKEIGLTYPSWCPEIISQQDLDSGEYYHNVEFIDTVVNKSKECP